MAAPTPRTAPTGAGAIGAAAYAMAAAPVLDFAGRLSRARGGSEAALVAEAVARLDGFVAAGRRAGLDDVALRPARLSLAVLLDQTARTSRGVDARAWSAAAHRLLFDGRDATPADVGRFRDIAAAEGPAFDGLRGFLDDVLARIGRLRERPQGGAAQGWALAAAAMAALLVLGLTLYVGAIEWRYHARLAETFRAEAARIDVAGAPDDAALADRLERLAAAADRVEAAAAASPLGLRLPALDSGRAAEAAYRGAVAEFLPPALLDAIGEALATEGDDLDAYDTLRAWAILDGQAEWSASFLSGWLRDRAATMAGSAGLAAHVGALAAAPSGLETPDPELMDQAREFAAAAAEADRAWLEMRRSPQAAALPPWRPDIAVPELGTVVVRRSGAPVETPIPGLFTVEGWAWARDYGAGTAVRLAREVAPDLLGTDPPRRNDTPDLLMDRLQHETVEAWRDWLADLRVRPFIDRQASLIVSGTLARRSSPLDRLMRAVWVQVGGTDRTRSYDQQLRVATAFGPMIQYVEQGGMADIAALFGALNVALGRIDMDAEGAADQLMSVQDRARSLAAMRQAPTVVVQIVEDVLAQTGAAHAGLLSHPLVRRWQAEVLPVCRGTLPGRYPFAAGPDADPADVAALLAPDGAVARFLRTAAERYLDTEGEAWRWKPVARLDGLSPESAVFLQRATALSAALFGPDGAFGAELTLAALAERGRAVVSLGGQAAPVRASGDAERLRWPGPMPREGIAVNFSADGSTALLAEPGPWGLLKLLDGLRLRPRDEGRRFLVDLRTETGRLFLEMSFERPANPVSARPLLDNLACPATL